MENKYTVHCLGNSYWTNCTQIECSLLRSEISYALYVTGSTEDGLLGLFWFHYELWIHIVGELFTPSTIF